MSRRSHSLLSKSEHVLHLEVLQALFDDVSSLSCLVYLLVLQIEPCTWVDLLCRIELVIVVLKGVISLVLVHDGMLMVIAMVVAAFSVNVMRRLLSLFRLRVLLLG